MKVIAFNGSPHDDGVAAKGISIMQAELEKEGIAVETIHVGIKISTAVWTAINAGN